MTVGYPNQYNASTTLNNALLFWQQGNHTSTEAKIKQVMITIIKEERNIYMIHISHWLWQFLPKCFITPQHILEKPSTKDCLIFNAQWKYHWDSIPINSMTSTLHSSKLHCGFSTV